MMHIFQKMKFFPMEVTAKKKKQNTCSGPTVHKLDLQGVPVG